MGVVFLQFYLKSFFRGFELISMDIPKDWFLIFFLNV